MKYLKYSPIQFSKVFPDGKTSIYVIASDWTNSVETREERLYNEQWTACTKEEYDTAFEQAMERINNLNNQK